MCKKVSCDNSLTNLTNNSHNENMKVEQGILNNYI